MEWDNPLTTCRDMFKKLSSHMEDIEKIQNEVHRYTISYHRLLRNKNLFGSKSSMVLKKKKN